MFNGERSAVSGFRTAAAAAEPPSDFATLRAQCLRRRTLYEDPDFGADDSSLLSRGKPGTTIEWMRPTEIVKKPKFFIDGASRFDVKQGHLGDCWLLAAIANLTLNDKLFKRVVPDDQEFDERYAGIFHFRIWQYGKWVDVVVDDRLPTACGELVYLRSANKNEFWSALLEKAYAKLHGTYDALEGGLISNATTDFTGGLSEIVYLKQMKTDFESRKRMFLNMLHAYQRRSLMGAAILEKFNGPSRGLVPGHAYSITKICILTETKSLLSKNGNIPLIRFRNPWGNEYEWLGPWSDKSNEWNMIPKSEKDKCGLTIDDDGEFWMSFSDFIQNFNILEMCHLNPDFLSVISGDGHEHKWVTSLYEGKWVRGATAGGSRKNKETFASNPQYRITLDHPDVMDSLKRCTVVIELMQKHSQKPRSIRKLLNIGFVVYRLVNPFSLPKPLDQTCFENMSPIEPSDNFKQSRQVNCRYRLVPGTYCIVPSTYKPNEEGEFLMRVFSENEHNLQENDSICEIVEISDEAIQLKAEPRKIHKSVKMITDMFLKKGGSNECIDWMDLKEILNNSFGREMANTKFSKDVCRSIIAMADSDRSGKLGYEEFKTLWEDIRRWKTVFGVYGQKKKGYITGYELRKAMNSVGYHLNTNTLNMMCHRYANKKGYISFDDFIMCAIRLKTMSDVFRKQDRDHVNVATFTVEEWLEKTLYL